MKKHSNQEGFISFLVIVFVALALGAGGIYYEKHKAEVKAKADAEANIEANTKAEENANANANLGIGATATGTLRALLAIGKDATCTFHTISANNESNGTVYISSDGQMSGDFSSVASVGSVESHMIINGETMYAWSGTQGAKMSTKDKNAGNVSAEGQTKSSVNLDSAVSYQCTDWQKDSSKFAIPKSVNFIDVDAMMQGNVNIPVNVKVN